jgi:HSP20 family molecular chaperone IbpA
VIRRIELQKPVRPDQVSAKVENGVLRIVAPASGQALSAGGSGVTVAVA